MSGDNVDNGTAATGGFDAHGFQLLGAEFTHLGRAFATADAALREPASGSDAVGAVTVVVGADGRVTDVRARPRWRELIAADQVGDTIVEAVQTAAIARLDRWSAVLDEQGNAPEPGPVDGAAAPTGPAATAHVDLAALRADAPYVDITGLIEELTAQLESAVAASTSLMAGTGDQGFARATSTSTSTPDDEETYGSRPVTVYLDGSGAPHRVDVALRWLSTVNRIRFGEAVLAAFARAYERFDMTHSSVARPGVDVSTPAGMTPQLQELIRNPAGVLASFAAQLP